MAIGKMLRLLLECSDPETMNFLGTGVHTCMGPGSPEQNTLLGEDVLLLGNNIFSVAINSRQY
jgi:hypothetical protein